MVSVTQNDMITVTLALLSAIQNQYPAQEMIDALGKLKTVSFKYIRILDYPSNGYKNELLSDIYLEHGDYQPTGARFHLKAQYNDVKYTTVYNGKVLTNTDKQGVTREQGREAVKSIRGLSPLKNNIIGMAQCVKSALAEENGSITVLDVDKFQMVLTKGIMTPFKTESAALNSKYVIQLDPKTKLPKEIVQTWGDADRIVTKFSDWNLNPAPMPDATWKD
jgi:outer membrane lipoprotein-sorting protein